MGNTENRSFFKGQGRQGKHLSFDILVKLNLLKWLILTLKKDLN